VETWHSKLEEVLWKRFEQWPLLVGLLCSQKQNDHSDTARVLEGGDVEFRRIDIVDSWFSNSHETEAIHPTTERLLVRSDGDSVGDQWNTG
jgi:hypothetical protein